MNRPFFMMSLLVVSLFMVTPADASNPTITGEISGVELCPQFICDAAIFQGTCDCTVNNRHTVGFYWISVKHDPLPPPLQSSAILGGKWTLTTLRGNFSGNVLDGSITNNGDNTYSVTARLRLKKRGSGDVIVSGILDHTEFPPTFEGDLVQP
jgi:hypothetical protein